MTCQSCREELQHNKDQGQFKSGYDLQHQQTNKGTYTRDGLVFQEIVDPYGNTHQVSFDRQGRMSIVSSNNQNRQFIIGDESFVTTGRCFTNKKGEVCEILKRDGSSSIEAIEEASDSYYFTLC
jgi:hypothetical protein